MILQSNQKAFAKIQLIHSPDENSFQNNHYIMLRRKQEKLDAMVWFVCESIVRQQKSPTTEKTQKNHLTSAFRKVISRTSGIHLSVTQLSSRL